MMRDFLVCSLWMWLLWTVWNPVCFYGIVRWNGARSWVICCAKRRGLTGNGRIVRFAFSMVSCLSAGGCYHECMRWLHVPVIPVCTGWWWGLRWYPVNRIVDDVHSSQTLGISMLWHFPCRICYRNGCVMIAFITEIQEPRPIIGGSLLEMGRRWIPDTSSQASTIHRNLVVDAKC